MSLPVIRGTDDGANCAECPFNGSVKVFAEGSLSAKFITVAEGPGGREMQLGRPLIGPSGEMLNKAFTLNKIQRSDVWLTNSSLCLEAGSQVRMADYSLREISELVNSRSEDLVQTVDSAGHIVSRRIVGWHRNPRGGRRMFKVTHQFAKNNRRGVVGPIVTEDHPILTPDGWIEAQAVRGGLIATGEKRLTGHGLDILYGTLLGDGYITKSNIGISQGQNQIEYAYLKMSAMADLDFSPHYETRELTQSMYGGISRASAWVRHLKEHFYENRRRKFPIELITTNVSPLTLAVWYMDDGCYYEQNGTGILTASSYSIDELEFAANLFRHHGVECTVRRTGPGRLYIPRRAMDVFGRLIASFVPPELQYKLPRQHRGQYVATTYHKEPAVQFWAQADTFERKGRRKGLDTTVYCIDVEDTHNFITPGVVVHNCAKLNSPEEDRLKAAECCAPRLEKELAQFDTKIPVLALGAVATSRLIKSEFKISQIAGTYHKRPDGREVIPTVHPAAILRAGTGDANHGSDLGFWSLLYDVQKVNKLANGVDIRFKPDVLPIVDDPQLAERLMLSFVAAARELKFVAVDTETYSDDENHSALELPYATLKAIGLATPYAALCFPWATCTDVTAQAFKELLADTSVTKIFHNGAYDVPVLAHHDMPVLGPIEDTMLLHHNAFPGLAHNLQHASSQFYAIEPWKSEHRHEEGADGMEGLLTYCAKDTLATARLLSPLQICVKRSDAERTYEVDQAMLRVATDMHANGVPFDQDINLELNRQFTATTLDKRQRIEASANEPEMFEKVLDELAFERAKTKRKKDSNDIEERHAKRLEELRRDVAKTTKKAYRWSISSSLDVIAYLKARGVRFSKFTDKGKTAIDKEVLEALSYIPEAKDVIDYREAAKMLSTYVRVLPFYAMPDGRIRPSWGVNKITGRWSSEFPNFMSMPGADPKKGRPNLRKQVRVSEKSGRRLVNFDFRGLEARVIALLSDDDFMVSTFERGEDIHDAFSRVLWGPQFDTVDAKIRKVLRNATKRFEFGAFYGGAVDTLWKTLRKDDPRYQRADVAKALKTLIDTTAGVQAWHETLIRKVAKPPHEIRSAIYGRRRVYPLGNAPPTETYNFGVQSTGADLMAKGLLSFLPKLTPRDKIILQVHDCLVVETDADDVDRVKAAMKSSFVQELHTTSGRSVVFDIDLTDGQSWGDV